MEPLFIKKKRKHLVKSLLEDSFNHEIKKIKKQKKENKHQKSKGAIK